MNKPAPVASNVHELIRERWSPRFFADRPVEKEALRSLFEAAQWAPSSYNEQPWVFFVGQRGDGQAYERLLDCLVPFNQDWAKTAPVLILSAARTTFARNGKPNYHALHDVGLATAQLTLQAQSLGLYVHHMAGFDFDKARAACALPEGCDPVAAMAVGYAGDPASLPEGLRDKEGAERSRKPLGEIVYAGRWGEAAVRD